MNHLDKERLQKVINAVKFQDHWRKRECINLIASENVMSPLATKLYFSDFMHRYAEGDVGSRLYQGGKYIDVVEELTVKLTQKLFNVKFSDVRPISGSIANLACFATMTKPGDLLFALSVPDGAHISHHNFGGAGIAGLKVEFYPFDTEMMNIDVDATKKRIMQERPRLLVFGGSVFLFPHPVKELKEIADEVGASTAYDAAHVLGLIAGKKFQDPVLEGVDIVSSSTHKTLPGPQGGLVFTNNETLFEKLKTAIFPGLVSNHHCHRLPALYITLLEMQEYGEEYADQIIKNAQKLATSLNERGFDVLAESHGFTKSHQVVVDVSSFGGGSKVAEKLEKANIILNKNLLPWDDIINSKNPSGVRIGVQEVTRFGMRENEMDQIAEFIEKVIVRKEPPARARESLSQFRAEFIEPIFCISEEKFE